ncbi:hypothetical protein EVU96_12450 [Bacillus infantis]|uniref:hypothetical protein n=1 Tax=Bacillus infantis TaxID=324767 RepID=UPI00101DDF9E|nr:hypothetical protein [Bacillus infantis]RYI28740.1 hypothetical protein EVU96_12450 [Bacillus infantis]
MKKLIVLPVIFTAMFLAACSELRNSPEGEFLLGNLYSDSNESGETYSIILPIEWTGEEPAVISSIELVKEEDAPVNFDEDGIAYEFYGADPLKKTGLYSGDHNIGEVKDINGFKVQGESRIVAEILLGEVKEDERRKAKITYTIDGEEYEEMVKWDTFEELST